MEGGRERGEDREWYATQYNPSPLHLVPWTGTEETVRWDQCEIPPSHQSLVIAFYYKVIGLLVVMPTTEDEIDPSMDPFLYCTTAAAIINGSRVCATCNNNLCRDHFIGIIIRDAVSQSQVDMNARSYYCWWVSARKRGDTNRKFVFVSSASLHRLIG